jgi:mitochondrial import inner membrane translocase subunit TIM44
MGRAGREPRCHEISSLSQSDRLAMLPRHLRRSIPTPSTFHLATNAYCPNALTSLRYRPAAGAIAPFHASSRRNDELPKSPFQTFVDVLRDELRKNRELQENVKQLQGDVDKLQDSETMRKARAAYERARVCAASTVESRVSADLYTSSLRV